MADFPKAGNLDVLFNLNREKHSNRNWANKKKYTGKTEMKSLTDQSKYGQNY